MHIYVYICLYTHIHTCICIAAEPAADHRRDQHAPARGRLHGRGAKHQVPRRSLRRQRALLGLARHHAGKRRIYIYI